MSHQRQTPTEQLAAYNRELAKSCPVSLPMWKAIKGLVYSGFILSIIAMSQFGAARWQLGAAGILAILVIFVGEVKEIEVANALTVTFKNGKREGKDP